MEVIALTGWGLEHIVIGERPAPAPPAPGEVIVAMHAAPVNFRDFVFAHGAYAARAARCRSSR